ncbi:MAG: ABC transporter substrate-binding protein [Deltaproteobacteria bacterium]|nr:ABC transporter substrate-binding protein [Deltaproteobacteria bacterium]
MDKVLCIFWLLVILGLLGQGDVQAAEAVKVKIGSNQLRISLPVFVAQEKGLFKQNGLDVELEMFETAQPLMDALCGGKLDVAGYTAFPIIFSAQLRSQKELYYTTLLMEDDAHPLSRFVVRKDSPIQTLSDLKGKNIGILPTFAYKVWFELILKKNGIQPDEVTIQQVAPAMTPVALESKTVEAVFTIDPAVTTCIQKGIGRLLFPGALVPQYMWSPFPFATFNMTREFVDKNPETARKLVKSLDEAIDFINANQPEAKRIMAKFLPEVQRPFVEHYPDAAFLTSARFSLPELLKIEESYRNLGITREKLDLSKSLYK